jgi:hypothetical protein
MSQAKSRPASTVHTEVHEVVRWFLPRLACFRRAAGGAALLNELSSGHARISWPLSPDELGAGSGVPRNGVFFHPRTTYGAPSRLTSLEPASRQQYPYTRTPSPL